MSEPATERSVFPGAAQASWRRTYQFGRSQLSLEFGDITASAAQVLVSSDDYLLTMGGGVSAALRAAGGPAIADDAAKKVPAPLGGVVVTNAGALPAQFIFHAVTIGRPDERLAAEEVVGRTTRRCLALLDALELSSIALPAIGAGRAGIDLNQIAVQMATVISDDLRRRERSVDVTIYLFARGKTDRDFLRFFEEFAARAPRLAAHQIEEKPPIAASPPVSLTEGTGAPDDPKLLRLHHLRKLMAALGEQRFRLEERLLELQAGDGAEQDMSEVKRKLRENGEARLAYRKEWKSLAEANGLGTATSFRPVRLFISYAREDEALRKNLEKQLAVLRAQGMITTWNDRLIKAGTSWSGEIAAELEAADVILLLVSADFLASSYINEVELRRAMVRHKTGEARVVPIILRHCLWADGPLGELQALPTDGEPVTSGKWATTDEAFFDVSKGLQRVIKELLSRDAARG